VRFYNRRGTAEQWVKEGKQAVKMTRLSCHRFRSNQVRLALSLLAYNLGNLWRRLALPNRIENWSLTTAAGEDGRTAVKTCPLLLAVRGGEPSDEMVIWQYARADRRAVASGGIAGPARGREIDPGPKRGGVSDKTGWKGRSQQLRYRRRGRRDTVRSSSPGQRENSVREPPGWVYSVGLLGAKTEIPIEVVNDQPAVCTHPPQVRLLLTRN